MARYERNPLSCEDIAVAAPTWLKLPKGPIAILALSGAVNVAWIFWLCWIAIRQLVNA
jgi:hypothetical protein